MDVEFIRHVRQAGSAVRSRKLEVLGGSPLADDLQPLIVQRLQRPIDQCSAVLVGDTLRKVIVDAIDGMGAGAVDRDTNQWRQYIYLKEYVVNGKQMGVVATDQLSVGRSTFYDIGKQAMQLDGYWTPGAMFESVPDTKFAYSWMPVPEKRRGKRVQVAGGHYIVIPTGAKHPEAMYKFGEVLNDEKICQVIYDQKGWLGARKSFLQKVDVSKYPGLDWFVKSAFDNDEFGEIPINPVEGVTYDTWMNLREQVFYGKMTAEEGVAKMQSDLEKALADVLKG